MTQTLPFHRPAIDVLTELTPGAEFSADGKVYTLAAGFTVSPGDKRGTFAAIDRDGRPVALDVSPKTRVTVFGMRYS